MHEFAKAMTSVLVAATNGGRDPAAHKPERPLDDHKRLPRAHPNHPKNRPGDQGSKPLSSPPYGDERPRKHTRGAGMFPQIEAYKFMDAENR